MEPTKFWRMTHFIPFLKIDNAYLARKRVMRNIKQDKILILFAYTFPQIQLIIESFLFLV